jgi:3-hydroxyisobutyrate dehydrogenase
VAKISVALLGVGTMGSGMGANLLKAGFPLTVYNRTPAKTEPLIAKGAKAANTPALAAKDAEIIISMLSDDAASQAAWMGANGALDGAKRGTVLVESSTVSPAWIVELSEQAKSRGLELLDAPVTGSRLQAQEGELKFLVGGSEEALAKAEPILRAMSKEVIHLGPVGSGAKMKLVNNFLSGVQVAALAEAIAWLERSGLDREKALGILKSGAPGSPLLAGISSRMVRRDYSVNFLLKLMSKDLQYAVEAAGTTGVNLTTAANARQLFEHAAKAGFAEEDMSAVVELVRSQAIAQS